MLLQTAKKPLLMLAYITLFVSGDILAQERSFSLEYTSSLYGSTNGTLPFWLHTNVDGKVDSSSTNWLHELRFQTGLYENGRFKLDAGGNLVGRISNKSSGFFSEVYLHANYKGYRLSIGRFPDPIGLNNHDLSVGSMMVSRNAIPIPKIRFSTPKFLDVPYTNGHVQFKGMFSHGWLESDRFVRDALLHQKFLYLRWNINRFSITAGAVHNVTWGGIHPEFGTLPQSFNDFIRVVTGRAAESGSTDAPPELGNALGNSIGAYETAVTYRHDSFTASLTRLFYLEDRVSTRLRSPWDGVWGLNVELKDTDNLVTRFTYEHINTKRQDANFYKDNAIGRANYYNNLIYESGWSYFDRVIGIPLFNFDPSRGIDPITNNIIIGHHLGINGFIQKNLIYTLFLTYSRNYGINPDKLLEDEINFEERRTDQSSLLFNISHSLPTIKNLSLNAALAIDTGQLYTDQAGLMFGITWSN